MMEQCKEKLRERNSCLMRGETKPYIYTVLTICDALNVTIADLLERQGYDENCEEDEDVREMIGKHYNHINQMIKNGGKITYVTSEDFNTVRDTTEYKDNQDTALTILKRLKDIYPDRVNIGFLPTPVNISMYYLKLHDGTEYINVKFNFQTYHGNDKHPMFDLFPNNPMFPIFQHEIVGLQKLIIPIE